MSSPDFNKVIEGLRESIDPSRVYESMAVTYEWVLRDALALLIEMERDLRTQYGEDDLK